MSGLEAVGIAWVVSAGNIASIVISVGGVIGAVVALIRYLRKNVTKGIEDLRTDMTKEMSTLSDKVESHEESTEKGIERTIGRMNEVKEMIAILDRRIDEVKNDVNKRLDEKTHELSRLTEKLEQLREEYYRLKITIVEKIEQQDVRLDDHEKTKDPPAPPQ